MSLTELLTNQNNDLTDHDLATLADWAGKKVHHPNPEWKRAYSLLREGCDLLLRRRARSTETLNGVQAIADHTKIEEAVK